MTLLWTKMLWKKNILKSPNWSWKKPPIFSPVEKCMKYYNINPHGRVFEWGLWCFCWRPDKQWREIRKTLTLRFPHIWHRSKSSVPFPSSLESHALTLCWRNDPITARSCWWHSVTSLHSGIQTSIQLLSWACPLEGCFLLCLSLLAPASGSWQSDAEPWQQT